MEMDMTNPTGSFIGHWLPGLAFVIWCLWWLGQAVRARGVRAPGAPIEAGTIAPTVKILILFIAGYIEMPNPGWSLASTAMGFHHISIYMGIAMSGVVDILARKGVLSARATYLAFVGAVWIGWLIFVGHGNHAGVESTAHLLLAWTFFGLGLITLAEVTHDDWGLEWLRIGGIMALGSWLIVISWMLFQSGWNLADPARVGLVYVAYVWTALLAAALVLAVRVAMKLAEPKP